LRLPLYIAQKYLWGKKTTNAINVITLIAAAGVMIIAAAMLIVLSVFNGFESLVLSLNRSFYADLVIEPTKGKVFEVDTILYAGIKALPDVAEIAPVLQEMALLSYKDRRSMATIKGVENHFKTVTGIDTSMIQGYYPDSLQGSAASILGMGIALELGSPVNDPFTRIEIAIPRRESKVGTINPDEAFNTASSNPVGIFSIQEEFDSKYVLADINLMRDLLNLPTAISRWEISLRPGSQDEKCQKAIAQLIGPDYKISTRHQQDEFVYKIMNTEKWVSFLLLTFILIIASFNIFGSLSMLVIEKKPDIGILKTMGATSLTIRRSFIYVGMLIAFCGGLAGLLLAGVFILLQQRLGLIRIEGDYFLLDYYPVIFEWIDAAAVIGVVLLITWIASIFPARSAAKSASLMEWKNAR